MLIGFGPECPACWHAGWPACYGENQANMLACLGMVGRVVSMRDEDGVEHAVEVLADR